MTPCEKCPFNEDCNGVACLHSCVEQRYMIPRQVEPDLEVEGVPV